MVHDLVQGLTALGTGPHLAWLFAGALIGTLAGVVPGLGGPVLLTMVLAFIYHLDLDAVLCLFLGTHAGSFFSSSIASILLNTPQHPESYAAAFDGFPMSQRGEAGRALGISAMSTCVGGILGCIALVGFIPIINDLSSVFHPPEYVGLVLLAVLLIATLGTDSPSKAIISAGLGLLLASVGPSSITSTYRFAFGAVGLYGGIALVSLALGCFAIPQMMLVFGTASVVARQDMMGNEVASTEIAKIDTRTFGHQVVGGIFETLRHGVALVRGAAIGVVTGLVPGIGAFAANFMSYGIAQQTSRKRALFGTGIAEGIIAPEASSLSKEAGGMVPLLGLGIPGGVGTALFLAALTIKGVHPGYGFATTYPTVSYQMVWIIALSGIIGTAAGVLLAPWLAKVTLVPGPCLVPIIMSLAVVGAFVSTVSFFGVVEIIVFAVLGFTMRRLRFSLASLVVGLVLGPTFEQNVVLTHVVYHWSFFAARPLADVMYAVALAILILKAVQMRRDNRAALKKIAEGLGPGHEEELAERALQLRFPYPVLEVIFTPVMLAITLFAAVYAATNFTFDGAAMPIIAGGAAFLALLWRLPQSIAAFVHYRRSKRAPAAAAVGAPVLTPEPVTVGGGGWDSAISAGEVDDLEDLSLSGQPVESASTATLVRERSWGLGGQYTRELAAFGWLVALVLLVYLVGFKVGVPVFCLVFAFSATRLVLRTLRARAIFGLFTAVVLWGITYLIFDLLHLTFQPLL